MEGERSICWTAVTEGSERREAVMRTETESWLEVAGRSVDAGGVDRAGTGFWVASGREPVDLSRRRGAGYGGEVDGAGGRGSGRVGTDGEEVVSGGRGDGSSAACDGEGGQGQKGDRPAGGLELACGRCCDSAKCGISGLSGGRNEAEGRQGYFHDAARL